MIKELETKPVSFKSFRSAYTFRGFNVITALLKDFVKAVLVSFYFTISLFINI